MPDINYHALLRANKVLVVKSIFFIVMFNLIMISKTKGNRGFMYNPRSLTLISMGIGDIILALFPLVVDAIMVYHGKLESCQTLNMSYLYGEILIHFVYAVGLIVLAVELVYRYKRQFTVTNTYRNIMISIICSAVPWFLGLVIILPMMLINTEWSMCGGVTRYRWMAVYSVAVVLPVCLALIVCSVVQCIRLPTTNDAVASAQNTGYISQQYPMTDVTDTQHITTSPPDYDEMNTNDRSALIQYVTEETPPQPLVQRYPAPKFANYYPLPPQYPQQQQQMVQSSVVLSGPVYTAQTGNPLMSDNPAVSINQNPQKEKQTLLAVSILMFICVMPFTVYVMMSLNRDPILDTDTHNKYISEILHWSFIWLSRFRSIITPIIWINSFRN
uniref:G-protein coupled receptors family 1 profile domain-containing protein n=1 Tax=Arion vulgaris TaxID=1028688 RepID=A0A0B7A994_9EUPU